MKALNSSLKLATNLIGNVGHSYMLYHSYIISFPPATHEGAVHNKLLTILVVNEGFSIHSFWTGNMGLESQPQCNCKQKYLISPLTS